MDNPAGTVAAALARRQRTGIMLATLVVAGYAALIGAMAFAPDWLEHWPTRCWCCSPVGEPCDAMDDRQGWRKCGKYMEQFSASGTRGYMADCVLLRNLAFPPSMAVSRIYGVSANKRSDHPIELQFGTVIQSSPSRRQAFSLRMRGCTSGRKPASAKSFSHRSGVING